MERQTRVGLAAAILLVALACAPLLPSVAPLPTRPAGAVSTMVFETRAASVAETARYLPPPTTPTITRTPSKTPLPSPTPTATFLFLLPTSTQYIVPSSTGGTGGNSGTGGVVKGGDEGGGGGGGGAGEGHYYNCSVLSVSPPNGSVFSPGQNIGTVSWRVRNTGKLEWNPEIEHPNLDYFYVSGPTLSTYTYYDTNSRVRSGDEILLEIGRTSGDSRPAKPAVAPTNPGVYTVSWAITVEGNKVFCQGMQFTFTVQ